jgi:hypothetical protein
MRAVGEREHDNPTGLEIDLVTDGYIKGTPTYRREYSRRYYHKTKLLQPSTRASEFKNKYGLTLEQAKAVVTRAEGKCECCGRAVEPHGSGAHKSDVANIDHCHSTGKVRGILCNKCNQALGLLNDKPELAVAYLEKCNARA